MNRDENSIPLMQVRDIVYRLGLTEERIYTFEKGFKRVIKIFKMLKFIKKINSEGVNLFEPVSFELSPGKVLVITGPPNSGKTVLAQIIARAILPSNGEIIINGRLCPFIGAHKLFYELGYARYNVVYISAECGCNKKEIKSMVPEILEWAEIKEDVKKMYELEPQKRLNLLLSIALHLPGDVVLIDGLFDYGNENYNMEKMSLRFKEICQRGTSLIITMRNSSRFSSFVDEEVRLVRNPALDKLRPGYKLEEVSTEEDEDENEI